MMFKAIWDKIKIVFFFFAGLVSIIWWAQRRAVGKYKEDLQEDVKSREDAVNDAVADAAKLSSVDRYYRMQREGWYRSDDGV